MKFLSVCSGIEAASVAWKHLQAVAFSEIEPFPCAVLKHHYPDVPNWGDMTKFKEWPDAAVDLLVGGTPCQSFSVAGLRKGLDDPRGNLMLTFGAIAARFRAKWVVWENVPGVLSSNGGRDFGTFLGMLAELGYGWAYRVLDAQHFGVPQRRRRVFVVGCLGDWRRAAAVLFERHSLSGNPAPSRKAREAVAGTIGASSGDWSRDNIGESVLAFDTTQVTSAANYSNPRPGDPCHPISAEAHAPAIAIQGNLIGRNDGGPEGVGASDDGVMYTLTKADVHGVAALPATQVRRLTPRECERLQGFPDDYTFIPWRGKEAPDGPRYKALGNSMAVPVMAWIGQRIDQVAAITAEKAAA